MVKKLSTMFPSVSVVVLARLFTFLGHFEKFLYFVRLAWATEQESGGRMKEAESEGKRKEGRGGGRGSRERKRGRKG